MKFRALVVLVAAAGLLGQLCAVQALAAERSVSDIQKALLDKGFRPGVPDGVWGKKSIAALRAYQTANGLPSTGTTDPGTIDRLFPPLATTESQKPPTSSAPEHLPDAQQMSVTSKEPDTPVTGPTQNHADAPSEGKPAEGAVPPANAAPVAEIHDTPQPVEKSARLTASTSSSSSTPASPALTPLGRFALICLAIGLIIVFRYRRKAKRLPAEVSEPDNPPAANLIWDREAFRTLTAETIRQDTENIPFSSEPSVPQSAKKLDETGSADVVGSDSSYEASPVEVVPSRRKVPPASSPERVASMTVHNKGVADWVQSKASSVPNTEPPVPQSAEKLDEIGATDVASSDSPYESAPIEAASSKRKLPPVYFSIDEVVTYLENMNSEVIGKLPGEGKPKLSDGTLVNDRDELYFDEVREFVVSSTAAATKASNGPFHGEFDRLILRLRTRLADPRLRFLFYPIKDGGDALSTGDFADVVRQFIGYLTKSNISIVDLSGIPFEVLSIVVSLISRMIFDFGFHYSKNRHSGGLVSDVPIMVVCEEAHNYLPRSGGAQYDSSRKSIERIAKEGRKYGVTLMVVSQRPSEVSETIFSQCSNFISLRLTNSIDQNYIKSLLPDLSAGIGELLPNLGQGEFLAVGDAPLMPTVGRFALPKPEPHSRSVNYLQEWNTDWREINFDQVIDRWRGSSS